MEIVLYCPDFGYYERLEQAPGRSGDFYTSVQVGSLFGRLLAAQFAEWLQSIAAGRPRLVEAGAHDGCLAVDILSWFEGTNSPVWPELEYVILEPSPRRRAWQAQRLARFADRVRWFESPSDPALGPIHGVLFSNELLDAFPVTRLKWKAPSWREMGVTWDENLNRFVWRDAVAATAPVDQILTDAGLTVPPELARVLPDGFTIDIAASVSSWWSSAAQLLAEGVLMTMDYGLTSDDLLNPSRHGGTLRAYRNHRLEPDVLAHPGEQDLTSHVNFTQLQRAGEAAGLETARLVTQSEFLTRIATRLWQDGLPPPSVSDVRQFQTLTHPEHLGSRFKVFVQTRLRG
jgi:SAM-dependent MidA family methyltransferase